MKSRPAWRLRCVAVGLCVAAAACANATRQPEQTSTTLVISQGGDPGALNPAVTTSGNTHPVTDQIFNGLVGLDEQLNPVPELAERWEIESDGATYRFHLRRDVRWHDGTPFTSADVKFTFEEALLKYHSRTRAALEGLLTRVETPDAHTVVMHLARPYGPLLQRLDVVEASIIPKHQYDGHDLLSGEPTRQPIGNGALPVRQLHAWRSPHAGTQSRLLPPGITRGRPPRVPDPSQSGDRRGRARERRR